MPTELKSGQRPGTDCGVRPIYYPAALSPEI
jgi:hypothetical protein